MNKMCSCLTYSEANKQLVKYCNNNSKIVSLSLIMVLEIILNYSCVYYNYLMWASRAKYLNIDK